MSLALGSEFSDLSRNYLLSMSNHFWPDDAQYSDDTLQTQQCVDLTKVAKLVPASGQDTLFEINDTQLTTQPKAAAKARSRQTAGQQQVKHRRTRSGCYTCRSRRVKVSLYFDCRY